MSLKIISILTIILIISVNTLAREDCGPNEDYNSCGTACPETCESLIKGQPQACTLQCVSGCFCKSGLYRDKARNNECVSEQVCRKNSKGMSYTKDPNGANYAQNNFLVFIILNLTTLLLSVFSKSLFWIFVYFVQKWFLLIVIWIDLN
jgi:hypothetical protein